MSSKVRQRKMARGITTYQSTPILLEAEGGLPVQKLPLTKPCRPLKARNGPRTTSTSHLPRPSWKSTPSKEDELSRWRICLKSLLLCRVILKQCPILSRPDKTLQSHRSKTRQAKELPRPPEVRQAKGPKGTSKLQKPTSVASPKWPATQMSNTISI